MLTYHGFVFCDAGWGRGRGVSPRKNLSSQLTQWELRLKLTESSFWGYPVTSQWNSQDELTLWACCELSVSLQLSQWATATTAWWAHWVISRKAHNKLTLWVANSWKAHSKLHCEVAECPQYELSVSFNESSQWVAVSSNSSLCFFVLNFVSYFPNMEKVKQHSCVHIFCISH